MTTDILQTRQKGSEDLYDSIETENRDRDLKMSCIDASRRQLQSAREIRV